MLKEKEYVTTVEKKPYPWFGQIDYITPKGTLICIMVDTVDGCFRMDCTQDEIRHYSAKEMADDIFKYFGEEEPNIENIYSKEFFDWLIREIKDQKEAVNAIQEAERTIEDPDYDNYTSAELAEIQHREEYAGMLICLMERLAKYFAHDLEIIKCMTVSTAHIRKTTSNLLEQMVETDYSSCFDGMDEIGELIIAYNKEEYGFFIYILDSPFKNEHIKEKLPDDLWNCICLAYDNGCTLLCLDRDGNKTDVLEEFEW